MSTERLTPRPGVAYVGVLDVARERVREAQALLDRALAEGGLDDINRGQTRLLLAQGVLASVERTETAAEQWATGSERLAAVADVTQMETEGIEAIRAVLDDAIDKLLQLHPMVDRFNADLRAASARARAGEPGGLPAEFIRHPGEINLTAYITAALRKADFR